MCVCERVSVCVCIGQCIEGSGGRTVQFGADGTPVHRAFQVRVGGLSNSGTARAPCHPCLGRPMVQYGADGTAHAPCHPSLSGQKVLFRAVGTALAPCLTGSGERTIQF